MKNGKKAFQDRQDKRVEVVNQYDQFYNLETKSYDPFRDGLGSHSGTGHWSGEVNYTATNIQLKAMFFQEDWVNIIIDLIAQKIAKQPLVVVRDEVVDGKTITEPAEEHELQMRLDRPNSLQDYFTWMYAIVVDDSAIGNGIIWNNRKTGGLWQLPAEYIRLDFNSNGSLDTYSFNTSNQDLMTAETNEFTFKAKDVIHVKRPNPSSYYWGLTPLIPGSKAIMFNRYTSDYLNQFYLQQATPGLTLMMDNEANEKQVLRTLRSLEMAHSGRRNARRTMILPKGVTAETFQQSVADQHLIELIDKNRETIINLFKVPKHELSLEESGSLGSEEKKLSLKNFWSSTLLPTQERIAGTLTHYFQATGDLEITERIEFDNSDVEILQEDNLTKADLAEALKATHTVNEIRAELYDMEPVAGGDQLESTVAPIDLTGQLFEDQDGATDTTPDDQETQEESQETQERKADVGQVEKVKNFLDKNHDWYDGRIKALRQKQNDAEGDFLRFTLDTLTDFAAASVRTAKRHLRDTKRKRLTKEADVKDKRKLRADLQRAFRDFEGEYIRRGQTELADVLDTAYNGQVGIGFSETDQQAIAAIKERDANRRRSLLADRQINTFANISKTTTDRVMRTIENGLTEGKSSAAIASDIVDNFRSITPARARTIARTEVGTAVSLGQAAALENASEVVPGLKKVWVNAGDLRVRARPDGEYPNAEKDHWNMQGQTRDHDKPFNVDGERMMFPRDPSGSAGNTINCRCDFILLPPDVSLDDV